MLLLLLSCFSRPTLCNPTDSSPPGKNTGVGCHFLLQCLKVKTESEVAQLCPTLSDPMDCSLPGSSVHGIFQARVLEWVAIAFSVFKDKNKPNNIRLKVQKQKILREVARIHRRTVQKRSSRPR